MKARIWLLFSGIFLVVAYLLGLPDGKMRVVFCDVGQGDAILATKGYNQLLIDTGPDNKKVLGCLERYMPFWDKKLEIVIISHEDKDHWGGYADVEKNYKIEKLGYGISDKGLFEQKMYAEEVRRNDVIRLGEILFEVINPSDNLVEKQNDNDGSVAGVLHYKDNRFLLTGDVSKEVEQLWVWRGYLSGQIDVLKVSHHGSDESTGEELLAAIKVREAVISVGRNSFGHPRKEVLDRLEIRGVKVRRTDKEGDVVYVID
ncbi:MAG: ComEC/Rec2 family competence protein [Patescibacteria group bacterium]|jgi:competence protein ComEC